ncbi:2-hydroxyacid dehydrogenase [Pseudomonas aeruginosa]|nr:2-hydroxyacid dehydrogenase [Pseudomonas aeruginosa]MCS8829172.1 2-hydroxyacid dehydrogenase [Pseudomonas aeruginosa]MCS8874007.1 2-hydroxyacid dehydrogenase [Pseudomonas aeruginosa]MCS8907995.1 2-hydroxyacid dehydrogenase [Pseudomonas aeruginosa]MCS8914046.1 2-hydroxyacid dehydrogenase [Pseudomonas aeruginosa]
MKPRILVLAETFSKFPDLTAEADFCYADGCTAEQMEHSIRLYGDEIRAVVTNGSIGLNSREMSQLPKLEIVCSLGVGYENIDLEAAYARRIIVTNGPGLNSVAVADHTLALLLALVRNIPASDTSIRSGQWNRHMRPTVSGKKLGICGLGSIGLEIAARAAGGFGMSVHYHNRRPRSDVPYIFHSSLSAMAEFVDFLVIATPGGAGTREMVDATVLKALGPTGFLVNIARGSVVDTAALVAALSTGGIAGAALDVFDEEPCSSPDLLVCPNTVFTPHVAGLSPEAAKATVQLVLENLNAHFAGRPVLTPVF